MLTKWLEPVRSSRINDNALKYQNSDESSLVFIDGYANGVFKGDNAWSTINPMPQPSQPGSVGPSDPTSFHDIDIEIPDMTIQNVGPQDITASASLADVYNAGQSINERWTVQSCKPAVNGDGQIILTMHIGANDSDGYIFGISYHITAIGLPQQRQIEAQQKPQQEDPGKKLEKYADLRQKGLLTEEEFQKLKEDLLSQM
jgi:Short C-terminal domain